MSVSLVAALTGYDKTIGGQPRSRGGALVHIDELDTWHNQDGPFVAPTTISWSDTAKSVTR